MEHCDLRHVRSHILNLHIRREVFQCQLKEAIDGRMANDPLQGLQYMPLHLDKHALVVEITAHLLKLAYCRHVLFAVAVFGGYQQGGTTYKLIVPFVDDAARAVPVEEVHSQE